MSNRLADANSPYLRQHAQNPVDWWPWCEAALAQARAQEKPILLSIGYSACHWCHVMAHESFEDATTAAVMNDLFICIKVDREERPDLDKIYQLAHQALTRSSGGWPLTVFLAPDDHVPFFTGTYFPKEPRYGMPPFAHVLRQVRDFWDSRRNDVRAQNASLQEFLADIGNANRFDGAPDDTPLRAAVAQIENSFDETYGGHRGAPKFPHGPEMELLLDLGASERVVFTLQKMADGGIHDQIGGGFCRYSVDERWEIPHFEKMLYDNAQLLPLYASVGSAPVAQRIVEWLKREMLAPSGGFYSALDADSEHEEGKFYVWQRDEVRRLLDAQEFAVADRYFGFDRPPNFENHAWNPIVAESVDQAATALNRSSAQVESLIASATVKLFEARSSRVRPGLDDKILTAWNALIIAGLARASRTLRDPSLQTLADSALEHLHAHAWRDGKLFATTAASPVIAAYLDDYAFLLEALIECLQSRWNARNLSWACQLADALLDRFEDKDRGGFFFTSNDHEKLIQRPKPWFDEAIPSGNGVAARNLLRLGHLIGETRYIDAAERTLRASFGTLRQNPAACAALLRALNDSLRPRTHAVVRCGSAEEEAAWRAALTALPRRVDVYIVPSDAPALPPTLSAQVYTKGGAAYVCRGTQCLPPITTPAAALASLSA
jgi:uncharacterized protein YyaL (SSP411 family)